MRLETGWMMVLAAFSGVLACVFGVWIGLWGMIPASIFTLTAFWWVNTMVRDHRETENLEHLRQVRAALRGETFIEEPWVGATEAAAFFAKVKNTQSQQVDSGEARASHNTATRLRSTLLRIRSRAREGLAQWQPQSCVSATTVDASREEILACITELEARHGESRQEVDRLRRGIIELKQLMEKVNFGFEDLSFFVRSQAENPEQEEKGSSVSPEEIANRIMEQLKTARLSLDALSKNTSSAFVVVEKMSERIGRVERISEETVTTSRRLEGKVKDISAILTIIKDVTEQTNLLALNAAIIAAQAGEHGRGLAVVADEIRELSERTSESTKEISELIQAFQEDSATTVRGIEKLADLLGFGVTDIREAAQTGANLQDEQEAAIAAARDSMGGVEDFVRQGRHGIRRLTDRSYLLEKTVHSLALHTSAVGAAGDLLKSFSGSVLMLSSGLDEDKRFHSNIHKAASVMVAAGTRVEIDMQSANCVEELFHEATEEGGEA